MRMRMRTDADRCGQMRRRMRTDAEANVDADPHPAEKNAAEKKWPPTRAQALLAAVATAAATAATAISGAGREVQLHRRAAT